MELTVVNDFQNNLDQATINRFVYYALNKILNSDWLNTNLTLADVWLAGAMLGNEISCQVSRDVM